MKRVLAGLAVLSIALLGCSGGDTDKEARGRVGEGGGAAQPAPTAERFSVTGTFTISDRKGFETVAGSTCLGSFGYDDITLGTEVVVKDAAGATLGVGSLSAGKKTTQGCEFSLYVGEIPEGHDFYRIAVGHRGEVNFSAAEIKSPIELALGD
jgi:hypothetical protein